MILSWVLIIIVGLLGIGGAILAIVFCETTIGKVGNAITSIVIASGLCSLTFWTFWQSEVEGDLYRVVKVYDMQGEQIAEYKGKFDLEEQQTDGVTKIKFDNDGKRHIIYCSTGTVIIDESTESEVEE